MDAPFYTGSSVPEINVSSLEPFKTDFPPAKVIICIEDGNDNLLDELLAPYELFKPSMIFVQTGEDVRSKIIEFYDQQVPGHAVCIMSAVGKLSEITLDLIDASITYKGLYQIQTLQGSFISNNSKGSDRIGTMSMTFSLEDGMVVGGEVVGPLIAATSILITVGSFFQDPEKVMEQ